MSGPVARVTGGASGMGAAVARRLSADGHRVVLNAGIPGRATPLSEEAVATFERIVAVNLRGTFPGSPRGLRRVRAQGDGGAIVVIERALGGGVLAGDPYRLELPDPV